MLRRSCARRSGPTGVGNTFADTLPVPDAILETAARIHKGRNVYRSAAHCSLLLNALATAGWRKEVCSELAERLRAIQPPYLVPRADSRKTAPTYYPIIVLEGLDGVGKTTVVRHLSERIGGCALATPDPALDDLRAQFRVAPEPIARLFYCTCNYLGAATIVDKAMRSPVVVDRWFASTNAMALAAAVVGEAKQPLPDPETEGAAYAWPVDLPSPDVRVVLDCPEDIRLKRMQGRGGANREEERLAADRALREAAMTAFARQGYRKVMVPNYMIAINEILDQYLLNEKRFAFATQPKRFTDADIVTAAAY